MLPSKALSRLQVLLLATIVLFAVATAYVSVIIQERQVALEKASHYDVAFTASQAVNEYLRFVATVTEVAGSSSTASFDETKLRYEILLNRYSIFDNGDFEIFLSEKPERWEVVKDFKRSLSQIEPLVLSLDGADQAHLILAEIAPLEPRLIGLASEANSYGGRLAANTQHTIIRLHWLVSFLTAGLVVSGLVLIGLLVWSNQLLRRTHQRLERTAVDLEVRSQHLDHKNKLFDAAINNMSQGLCMVAPSGALIVSNSRFSEIYNLPSTLAEGEKSVNDIIYHCAVHGIAPESELKRMFVGAEHWAADKADHGFDHSVHELSDARIIAINRQPLDDGGWVTTHEDVTEHRRAQAKIAFMARHDTLTGLPNRDQFRERLVRAQERIMRNNERFAVICFDLDRFKNVNDTLGHSYGDLLLQEVAERARSLVRDSDVVARFGGDEFAIIQMNINNEQEVAALARSLLHSISEPYDLDGHRVIAGASVGVVVVDTAECEPDVLIKNADTALYRAKSSGGNLYRFFDAGMDTRLQARRGMELDLWNALERGEFSVSYQPMVSFKNLEIVGVEALLRWRHPVKGFVPPSDFIPVAEDIGLIESLGAFVLRTACCDIASWPRPVRLAVNLSSLQLSRGDLVGSVADALNESGLPARQLELEITESILVQENVVAHSVLQDLRSMDIGFALDDFGTGYSSLSYIRSFPVQKIKIDRSFIRDVTHNIESQAIIRAVTALADSLDISTTAEGIETEDQFNLLHLAGCDEAQGYLFSPPRPANEIVAMLEKPRPAFSLNQNQKPMWSAGMVALKA